MFRAGTYVTGIPSPAFSGTAIDAIGQGRMPELPDRHRKHPMLDRPERIADPARGAKLDGVPLAVVE